MFYTCIFFLVVVGAAAMGIYWIENSKNKQYGKK